MTLQVDIWFLAIFNDSRFFIFKSAVVHKRLILNKDKEISLDIPIRSYKCSAIHLIWFWFFYISVTKSQNS